ncbi:MAG: penicillin acylase family protein, partial [Candidatus Latescibacterota bacterium]
MLLALLTAFTWGVVAFLSTHTTFLYSIRGMYGSVPPIGSLLDPYHGLWFTARTAGHSDGELRIAALKEPVTLVRDARGVPHIFAQNERDAVIATGYAVAQDRLFQLDFMPRAAAGRLSEVFGPDLVETDRYLRSTGMEWAAQMNMDSIRVENGIANDLLNWFAAGVNARIEELSDHQLPIEFRLLGYRPDKYEPVNGVRLLQFMAFDLSFNTDDSNYGELQQMMNEEEYEKLFPRQSFLYEPIVPPGEGWWQQGPSPTPVQPTSSGSQPDSTMSWLHGRTGIESPPAPGILADLVLPGFKPGKGSNNWAVTGSKSETGGAILAGDMHLDLTLPAIWYELHVVTPTLNTHGVLIPGSPLPVEAFNDRLGWAFTNTGADQVDHYRLVVDSSRTSYRFNEKWLPFDLQIDTIRSRWTGLVPDTLRFTRFGPVMGWPSHPVAVQWTAHKRAKTFQALWKMHHATDLDSFQEAIRFWDSPMQNILYADRDGNIAIRSAGHLPIRRAGHGAGLLDGTTDRFDWIGWIPFDELPYTENPKQKYLASANQQPTDDSYPYYLGHNWYRSYRSLRINELLR